MNTTLKLTLAVGATIMLGSASVSAESYTREGNQKIEVTQKGGKLFCTRVADGYEMCHGRADKGNGPRATKA